MGRMYLTYGSACEPTLLKHSEEGPVHLLVSYLVAKRFDKIRGRINLGSLMLDSGAFTAWNSGNPIDNEEYLRFARDFGADEVIALDVINDPVATRRNTERAWELGIPAIPTFHTGEPWAHLEWMERSINKIGVSAKTAGRLAALQEFYAHLKQPTRVHGMALASWKLDQKLPFDSVDATSWYTGPDAYGVFAGYNGRAQHVRPRTRIDTNDYWMEVQLYRRREIEHEWSFRNYLRRARDRRDTPIHVPAYPDLGAVPCESEGARP